MNPFVLNVCLVAGAELIVFVTEVKSHLTPAL